VVQSGRGYLCFLSTPQYAPTTYTYADPYGRQFVMGSDGALKTITDLNNNTLTFSCDGITSSAGGRQVRFVRDSQDRITQVIDPDDNVYAYGYDAAGDLKTVTFPKPDATLSTNPVITYFYSTHHAHLYERVDDPLGRRVDTTAYYTSPGDPAALNGRVKSSTTWLDATTAFTTSYRYDLAALTTTITNPDGGQEVYSYDEQTYPHGTTPRVAVNMTSATIDVRVHPQTGQVERSTTRYGYDAQRNVIAVALPDPITGQAAPLATDPAICAARNLCSRYDTQGNQTHTIDALGRTSIITYTALNRPSHEQSPDGQVRVYSYPSVLI
jgi:YD repeat-containing protein